MRCRPTTCPASPRCRRTRRSGRGTTPSPRPRSKGRPLSIHDSHADVLYDHVRTRVTGSLGHVTLARPRALNALSLDMIRRITSVLRAWESDSSVQHVLLDGEGPRGFCAGGDVKAVYDAMDGQHHVAQQLWREQHLLDALIASYRKPVVTLLHGIVLGGGVGLGCHASHRLVTPTSAVGMPEVGIGLSPDVGALYILGRAPGQLGFHLALTGTTTGPLGAVEVGLADTVVGSGSGDELTAALSRGVDTDDAVRSAELGPGSLDAAAEPLLASRDWIADCYAAPTVEGILTRLDARPEPEAAVAGARLREVAPAAVKVTLRGLQRVVDGETLSQTLVGDLRRNVHFSFDPDFREGLRAAVIEKDRNPSWAISLDQVTDERVESYFAPIDGPDLAMDTVLDR
ncbi:enoyl-CoA hydratase/isomerase family protein [Ornithinimicrobium avium]|uniref:3-hydroxyisobutyryl-CoA hydrolase n=1 Tax=Ornithinimicrobium avium TaxID=2283195 RepID=A0A345NNQ5_9MICO|nr:3-hydroxyisobutyryl-CoA hydrolase [Ornithinimicrobium avium]AXH96663.1 enoyl-CoA hydratase/isomerase family protein [Ornithinimicrobium avium]